MLGCCQTLGNVAIEKFIVRLLSKFCCLTSKIISRSVVTSTLNLQIHKTAFLSQMLDYYLI